MRAPPLPKSIFRRSNAKLQLNHALFTLSSNATDQVVAADAGHPHSKSRLTFVSSPRLTAEGLLCDWPSRQEDAVCRICCQRNGLSPWGKAFCVTGPAVQKMRFAVLVASVMGCRGLNDLLLCSQFAACVCCAWPSRRGGYWVLVASPVSEDCEF